MVVSPEGTAEWSRAVSVVPSGLNHLGHCLPNVENVGLLSHVPPGQGFRSETELASKVQILVALQTNPCASSTAHSPIFSAQKILTRIPSLARTSTSGWRRSTDCSHCMTYESFGGAFIRTLTSI